MTLLLAFLATMTLGVSCLRFGWNSLVSLGLLGTYIYSSPAFFGLTMPFHLTLGERGIFGTLSTDTLAGLSLVWATLLLLAAGVKVPVRKIGNQVKAADRLLNLYLISCTILAGLGFIIISATLGPMYFLQDRSEIQSGFVMLLWRWTLVFGFILAIRLKRWLVATFFIAGLTVYFIAGDRTMPAISAAALILIVAAFGKRRQALPSFPYVVFGVVAFAFLLLGKPIYLAIKFQSLDGIDIFFTSDAMIGAALSFEPLATINILDYSINNSLSMPIDGFLASIFGNFLIAPGLFGVDTNYFNTFFTAEMPASLGFGVAGNYYANGYVAFGFVGLVIFAIIFFYTLVTIEKRIDKSIGVTRLVYILIGATISIYSHRNGLDNILSFVRQIIVVAVAIWAVSQITRLIIRPRRRHIVIST